MQDTPWKPFESRRQASDRRRPTTGDTAPRPCKPVLGLLLRPRHATGTGGCGGARVRGEAAGSVRAFRCACRAVNPALLSVIPLLIAMCCRPACNCPPWNRADPQVHRAVACISFYTFISFQLLSASTVYKAVGILRPPTGASRAVNLVSATEVEL